MGVGEWICVCEETAALCAGLPQVIFMDEQMDGWWMMGKSCLVDE